VPEHALAELLEELVREAGAENAKMTVADRGARRVESASQEVTARIDDANLVSPRGSPFHPVDRLRVNPRMSGPHGLDVTCLQPNRCQCASLPRQPPRPPHTMWAGPTPVVGPT